MLFRSNSETPKIDPKACASAPPHTCDTQKTAPKRQPSLCGISFKKMINVNRVKCPKNFKSIFNEIVYSDAPKAAKPYE